jgi:hypothetical protein
MSFINPPCYSAFSHSDFIPSLLSAWEPIGIMTDQYLSRREASEYLKAQGLSVAATTLGKFVTVGGGPKYRRFGRNAVYTVFDLDAWAIARLGEARTSSSQRAS